jgi:uncharacterized membrane protein YbaN (DUF454 family)
LGLTKREKISIYLFVLALLTPVFIFSRSLHLRIFLAVLMVAKGVFFLRIKTAPRQAAGKLEEPMADTFPPGAENPAED